MNLYQCSCGAPLFFVNSQCLACGQAVGYDCGSDRMLPANGGGGRICANGRTYAVCNWLTPNHGPDLCVACRTNRVIPELSRPEHIVLWGKMESAKRRTFHWLLRRRLPVASRQDAGPRGLAFDILLPQPNAPVTTGHDQGLITLNLEEASNALRERNRQELREPYRTLPGHFRHELAHYYWWLWFAEGGTRPEWLPALRGVFGDDRADYTAALRHYYTAGAPDDWELRHITAYAAMHPWEDWAETWAHYTHITEALETAKSTCVQRTSPRQDGAVTESLLALPEPFSGQDSGTFAALINDWHHLAPALNELALGLGYDEFYPFSPAPAVLRKMHCIHCMISAAGA